MRRRVGEVLGVLLTLGACGEPAASSNAGGAEQAGASGIAAGGSRNGAGGMGNTAGNSSHAAGEAGRAAGEAGRTEMAGSRPGGAAGSTPGGGASGAEAGSAASGAADGSGAGSGSAAAGGGGAGSSGGVAGMGGVSSCPSAGHAIEFDGDARTQLDTDSAIGSVLPKGNASRTVEMWIYTVPKSWRAEHHLYQFGGTSRREGAFGIDFGDGPYPNIQVYTNGTADTTFKVPQDSVKESGWFHLAMVWDAPSSTLKGVINGVTAGKKIINTLLTTSGSRLSIGYSPTFSSNGGFTGKIDEFRIWNAARTDAEIKASMRQRLTGKEPGLVVYFRFDEGSGASSKDLVGGYDAKFGGTTQPKWTTSDVPLTCP